MADFAEIFNQAFLDESEELKKNKPNLMIVGASGVGKSSLINYIFGETRADTDAGSPITQSIECYSSESVPINIYDTMGYETKYGELGTRFENEVLSEIERRKKLPLKDQIHVIWYCLSITNHRVFSYDIKQITNLQNTFIPVFIALTKCDADSATPDGKGETAEAYKATLKKHGIKAGDIFETATEGLISFDIDPLLAATSDSLTTEGLREAFNFAQQRNIPLKRKSAQIIIHTASAAAAAAAASPLPCADAPVLIGIQMAMAGSLAKLYSASFMGEAAKSLLQSQILSMLGRQLAASLLKLFPGFGSIVNAGVASALTESLGWALATIYEKALTEYLATGQEPVWAQLFSADNFAYIISQLKSAKKLIS